MNIRLELHINKVNAILQVLGKLPYEQVVGLIDEIRGQVAAQTAESEPPPSA